MSLFPNAIENARRSNGATRTEVGHFFDISLTIAPPDWGETQRIPRRI